MPKKTDLLPAVVPHSTPQWLDRAWPSRRPAKPLRVDFYGIKYGVPGSQIAHDRACGDRRNPMRWVVAMEGADKDMVPDHRKMLLPGTSPSFEEPEVIFYCTLNQNLQPHFHHLCRKIFLAQDNILPDWRYADWGKSFDAPSERNFHSNWVGGHPGPAQMLEIAAPPAVPAETLAKKSRFCAFLYFEPYCASRLHFLELLSRTMRVEAAGKALRSVRRALQPRWTLNALEGAGKFYRPYKFVISFENVRVAGFNAEKMWSAFRGDAVPIYLGDPNITEHYNPEAFIHARDFDSLESLARYVMRVHNDDALYLRYLSQPRFTEAQRARWRTYHEDYAAFERKALFTPPVGAHAPRAQRDSFLRETISRLESKINTRLLAGPHRDFRPGRGSTGTQMRRIWRGETP